MRTNVVTLDIRVYRLAATHSPRSCLTGIIKASRHPFRPDAHCEVTKGQIEIILGICGHVLPDMHKDGAEAAALLI
jgi:hypothetical protein